MTDAICYCIQEPSPFRDPTSGAQVPRDLSSAARYGRLEFLLNQDEKPSLLPGPSFFKIHKKLRDFRPDKDFIFVAGGDPLACGLAFAALVDLGHTRVNFLRWERERGIDGQRQKSGFYVPVSVKVRFFANEKGEQQDVQGELF